MGAALERLIIIAAAVPFPRGVAVLARRVRPGRRRLDRCNPRQDQKKSQDPFHDFLNLPGKPPTTTHTELATANSERNRASAWRSYLQRYSENTGNAQVASTGRGSVGEFHISRSPTLLGRAGGVPQRPPPRPFGAQRMPGPHRARPRWHDPERGATQRSQTVRFGLGGLRWARAGRHPRWQRGQGDRPATSWRSRETTLDSRVWRLRSAPRPRTLS